MISAYITPNSMSPVNIMINVQFIFVNHGWRPTHLINLGTYTTQQLIFKSWINSSFAFVIDLCC